MNNQKGFSLIQAILALTLMSVLILAVVQLTRTQEQLGKSSSHEFEIIYITDEMRNLLSRPENCEATLKGHKIQNSSVQTLKKAPTEKLNSNPTDVYEVYSLSQKKYGQNNIAIQKITLEPDHETRLLVGTTNLKITFDKGQDALDYQDRFVTRSIKIHARFNEDFTITHCYSLGGIAAEIHDSTNKIWTSIPNSPDLYFSGGRLSIGTQQYPSQLTLNQGFQFKDGPSECKLETDRALRYNTRSQGLELCLGDISRWTPLSLNKKEAKQERLYSLNLSRKGENEQLKTEKPYKFCYLKNFPRGLGHCQVVGNPNDYWSLKADNFSLRILTCHMSCIE